MTSTLFGHDEEGFRTVLVPPYEYQEINIDEKETRFLILQPCSGDKGATENHVSCNIETQILLREEPIPFTAVYHARGYKKLHDVIEIDGKALLIPTSLEKFLRHFRRSDEPIRLWIRHICININNPDENTRLWTREFSDFVYEKAESLVDMSETLAVLLEQETIVTQHDSRYSSWTKKYYDVPDEFHFPSVFPIKLGNRPTDGVPGHVYKYVPLDMVADEIRVLIVEMGEDTDPIDTHLGHCPMVCEVGYHAISYAWGDEDEAVETIRVSGQKMIIRKKLANMLRALRRPNKAGAFWIDQICIDQSNIVERNRQLLRMSAIYDRAMVVIAYLGEPDQDSDLALDLIPRLQSPLMRYGDDQHWILSTGKDTKDIDPVDIPRYCGALYRLLTRPYFRRVWVIQEIALASNIHIGLGKNFGFALEKLSHAATNLQSMLERDLNLAGQMIESTTGLTEVRSAQLSYARMLFYYRHISSGGESAITGIGWPVLGDRPSKTAPGFLETILMTRRCEATVPSDKVYALWNVPRDKEHFKFQMDYSHNTAEAYSSFAASWAEHTGSLDVIGAAEFNPKSEAFYRSAPSWCPDWSTPGETSCLIRKDILPRHPMITVFHLEGQLYSADGRMTQARDSTKYFHFDGDTRTLHCTGVILDRFQWTNDEVCDEDGHTKFQAYLAGIRAFYENGGINPYGDEYEQAAWAAFFGDTTAAWLSPEDNPENVDKDVPEDFVCVPEKSRHIIRFGGSYSRLWAIDILRQVTQGREMVITEKGYLALAPKFHRGIKTCIAILAT